MQKNKSVMLLLLVIATIAGCSETKKEGAEAKAKKPMGVEAAIITEQILDHTFSFTGSLMANEVIELKPETSGRIIKINFSEGKAVTKGQLLVKINDNELQAQLKKSLLLIELAADDEKRKKELLAINGISREEYDNALSKLKTLQADKELIQAQIAKTEIVAPFAGVLGFRQVSEGAFVSQSTVISTLQQTNPIKVEFSLPEKYGQQLSVNKEVRFTVQGSEKTFKANIYAIDANVDAVTRTIKLRASCPNPDGKLISGAFANILFDFSKQEQTMVVPARAIVPVLNGSQVFVIKNGKAKGTSVTTGVRTATEVELLKGPSVGDTIILSGLLQIKDGAPVMAKVKEDKKVSEAKLAEKLNSK
jgi:membrane fusion protein, multidrug efflux system